MANEVARGVMAGVPKEADTVLGGVTRNTVSVSLCKRVEQDFVKNSELGARSWAEI